VKMMLHAHKEYEKVKGKLTHTEQHSSLEMEMLAIQLLNKVVVVDNLTMNLESLQELMEVIQHHDFRQQTVIHIRNTEYEILQKYIYMIQYDILFFYHVFIEIYYIFSTSY
ncbi:MAG: hypothetical protein EZS28_002923, partial [Streblomastix strix]